MVLGSIVIYFLFGLVGRKEKRKEKEKSKEREKKRRFFCPALPSRVRAQRARNFLRRGTGSPQSQSQQFKWDWMGLGLLDSELVGLGTSFQPLAVGLDWTRTFRNSQSVGLD